MKRHSLYDDFYTLALKCTKYYVSFFKCIEMDFSVTSEGFFLSPAALVWLQYAQSNK